jgi:hypothetical protein
MAKVKARVYVRAEDGSYVVLKPGDTVPDWADVTNPDVLEDDAPAPVEDTEPAPAPKKRTTARKADADS